MANRENIFLRKDGRFEARYRKGRNNNGKLIYGFCYGKTYEEAQEKAGDFRRRPVPPKAGDRKRLRLPITVTAGLFPTSGA